MIRATRSMWRSPRQLLRASKAKSGSATGSGGGKQRSMCDLTKQESTIGGQQRHAFGRTTMDVIPKALAIGAVDALNVGAMDALVVSLKDLAEDDDGR
ncbi:hypothetical protein Gpo141_00008985 [Globisporangium polare]